MDADERTDREDLSNRLHLRGDSARWDSHDADGVVARMRSPISSVVPAVSYPIKRPKSLPDAPKRLILVHQLAPLISGRATRLRDEQTDGAER